MEKLLTSDLCRNSTFIEYTNDPNKIGRTECFGNNNKITYLSENSRNSPIKTENSLSNIPQETIVITGNHNINDRCYDNLTNKNIPQETVIITLMIDVMIISPIKIYYNR